MFPCLYCLSYCVSALPESLLDEAVKSSLESVVNVMDLFAVVERPRCLVEDGANAPTLGNTVLHFISTAIDKFIGAVMGDQVQVRLN